MVFREANSLEPIFPDNMIKLINSENFSLLMVYNMFIKDHIYVENTTYAKCISPNNDYNYFEYIYVISMSKTTSVFY